MELTTERLILREFYRMTGMPFRLTSPIPSIFVTTPGRNVPHRRYSTSSRGSWTNNSSSRALNFSLRSP
jgi:hypothetical protein